MADHAGAAGFGEELGAEPDQATRGHEVLEPDPTEPVVDHVLHPALASGEQLRDDSEVLFRDIDRDPLDRFVTLAVDLFGHDLGLADVELEALATHRFDEHGELQLTAGLDFPGVGTLGRVDADADVADQLGVETVLDEAGGQLLAVPPGEG